MSNNIFDLNKKNKKLRSLFKQISNNTYKDTELKIEGFNSKEEQEDEKYGKLDIDDTFIIKLLDSLKTNNTLKHLALIDTNLSCMAVACVLGLKNIETITIYNFEISKDVFLIISMSTIKEITLAEGYRLNKYTWREANNTDLLNHGFQKLCKIEKLFFLRVKVDKDAIKSLFKFNSSITHLGLCESRIIDGDFYNLKDNYTITDLDVSDNNITDKGVKYICKNKSIQTLCLYETNVTDAAVKKLSRQRNISKLDLGETLITKKSIEILKDNEGTNVTYPTIWK
jgi:hypothetical protein